MDGYGIIIPKNMKFLIELGRCSAMSDAAANANISRSHAIRLVNEWIKKDWVVRAPRKEKRYDFTEEGLVVLEKCKIMLMNWEGKK